MDEPILIIDASDATRLWGEDGRWLELEEPAPRSEGSLERWRAGVSAVLTLAAAAGICAVGLTPVRTAEARSASPAPVAASAEVEGMHRAMFSRIVQLEEENQRLYEAIEATHWQLAAIEVMRARMEAAAAPEEPVMETADAGRP